MSETKYGDYIATDLRTPDFITDFKSDYAKYARRILWMDNDENQYKVPAAGPEYLTHYQIKELWFFVELYYLA